MLMFGSISGTVPFTVQYTGRHISQMKVKLLKTELLAEGTTGKIQFGAVPGLHRPGDRPGLDLGRRPGRSAPTRSRRGP